MRLGPFLWLRLSPWSSSWGRTTWLDVGAIQEHSSNGEISSWPVHRALRAWVPTWRFFDAPDFELEVRWGNNLQWVPIRAPVPSRWWHALIFPAGTQAMWELSRLRRYLESLTSLERAEPQLRRDWIRDVSLHLETFLVHQGYEQIQGPFSLRAIDAHNSGLWMQIDASFEQDPLAEANMEAM